MTRLVWVAGWVAVAVWSLFAAVGYLFVDALGAVAMRNADMFSADPETVEQISTTFRWLHGLSTSIVLVVWGFVSLAILAVPWILDRAVGRRPPVQPVPRRPDGVIDLAPGDYNVRPDPARHAGPVPRIPPR